MATIASDGSPGDVQTKINGAANGDIVTLPAGSFTWTTGVSLSKAVHIRGAGSGRIVGWGRQPNSFGTGSKVFNLVGGRPVAAGTTLRVWQMATPKDGSYMRGTVTSWVGNVLTMNITTNTGAGSPTLWLMATEPTTTVIHTAGSLTLINITETIAGSPEISGLHLINTTIPGRTINLVYVTNGEPVKIHDCWFYQTAGTTFILDNQSTNRGVIWNISVNWSFFALSDSEFLHFKPQGRTSSWSTPSTMGTADTTGKNNFYVEDSDFHGGLDAVDSDDNGRLVWRYNIMDNAACGGHGYDTSPYGSRHVEYYNNQFLYSDVGTNSLNQTKMLRIRGGTGVITDNFFENLNSSRYGNKNELHFGVWALGRWIESPGAYDADDGCVENGYPAPRQFGYGYVTGTGVDGHGNTLQHGVYVGDSEPVYMWNNTGFTPVIEFQTDGTPCVVNPYGHVPDRPTDYMQLGRDYFTTAKPGYTKYVYPHPLRGGSTGKIINLSGDMTFENVIIGENKIQTLSVSNLGDTLLTITGPVVSSNAKFTLDSTAGFTVAAGTTHDIAVTYTPTTETTDNGTITFDSNADTGVETISCSGTGVPPVGGGGGHGKGHKKGVLIQRSRT